MIGGYCCFDDAIGGSCCFDDVKQRERDDHCWFSGSVHEVGEEFKKMMRRWRKDGDDLQAAAERMRRKRVSVFRRELKEPLSRGFQSLGGT